MLGGAHTGFLTTSDAQNCPSFLRDFLSGFHKRKVQQKEESRRKARERERQERLEARREVCHRAMYLPG